MTKRLILITSSIVLFLSLSPAVYAANLCTDLVQAQWPDWIGKLVCLEQKVQREQQMQSVPIIPERYQSLQYDRLRSESVEQEKSAGEQIKTGEQWWPDWIGKPEWY